MSYLVLARKYRPQTFTDMIGQGHVVRTLTNAIRQGRVAHAFLFTGARGVGKTSGARLLAKSLNCESGPTAEPCGDCMACSEITAGNSVDVQEIDGASNNGVDQVRELRENARYLPSRDKHKIYIIDEVHMLSGAAFNALLKTLEEPPAHVKFIFATTEPHKIPVTILSRTQRFDFRRIPLGQIVDRVESILDAEGISMSTQAATLVARQAEGSMRDALSLLDQVISAGGSKIDDSEVEEILGVIDRTEVASLAGALMDGDGALALEIVARVFERGLDLARLAEDLAWHLRNLLVLKVGGRTKDVLDVADHELAGLEEQASGASSATLSFLFDVIHGAIPEIGRAVQPRLVLEVSLLKAIHMAPGVDLAGLLERVEELAKAVGSGSLPPGSSRRPPSALPSAGGGPGAQASGAGRVDDRAGRGSEAEGAATMSSSRSSSEAREQARAKGGGAAFEDFAERMAARAEAEERESMEGAPRAEEARDELDARRGPEASSDTPSSVPSSGGQAVAVALDADAPPVEEVAKSARSPKEPDQKRSSKSSRKKKESVGSAPVEAVAKQGAASVDGSSSGVAGTTKREGSESAGGKSEAGGSMSPQGSSKEDDKLPKADDPSKSLAERYAALVEAITSLGRRPFLASALEHARPMSVTDESLVLALPRGLYYDGIQNATNRRALETLIEDHFGVPLHLRVEIADEKKLEGAPESIAALKERSLAEESAALRAEALENPAVRLAVESLDGEIESVRIMNGRD